MKEAITPEESAEARRIYKEYCHHVELALECLQAGGGDPANGDVFQRFLDHDRIAGKALKRVYDIYGIVQPFT